MKRVLIIDDCRDASFPLQRLLELDGHQVEVAQDGERGLELVRTLRPQLVLCDIQLPGAMLGYDVARALRAEKSLGPMYLVAVTGYDTQGSGPQILEAGFDRHLTKPIGQVELRELIECCEERR